MRLVGLMIALCLATNGPLCAASEKATEVDQGKQESPSGEGAAGGRKSSARSQKPAKTFKPSERIRADSAVSFPVDI
jgi:hypothetical protein